MKLYLLIFYFLSSFALSQSTWPTLSGGYHRTCALFENGRIKCWGFNYYGQLGLGDMLPRGNQIGQMGENLPFVDLGKQSKAIQLSLNGDHSCALLDNGRVKCWGLNIHGQLGLGDTQIRGDKPGQMGESLPLVDLGSGNKVIQISAHGGHTCALFDNGRVKCWGLNFHGQLGLGNGQSPGWGPGQMGDNLPFIDLDSENKIAQISAGEGHNCAIFQDGRVKCWGHNQFGQLGLGDTLDRGNKPNQMGSYLPYVDLGTRNKAVQISTAGIHTCVLFDNNRIKCWGYNNSGELGVGDNLARGYLPNQMGDSLPYVDLGENDKVAQIHSGRTHSCALFITGKIKCWGYNNTGQLGLGDQHPRGTLPTDMGKGLPFVSLGLPVQSLAMGPSHSCATLVNGGIKCWGYNIYGTLGQENTETLGDMPGEMGNDLPYVDLGIGFHN